jgi:hypothetical protein
MGRIFVAENGEKLEARDDIQAVAFELAGLKEVIEKKK